MEKTTKTIIPNNEILVFVCQNASGWAKGLTLKEAANLCKEFTRKKPTTANVYLVKDGHGAEQALETISVTDFNITYNAKECILLHSTDY